MGEQEPGSNQLRYGVAVAAVALAVIARLLLDPLLGYSFPFATLFFAVLFSAGYGGFGPAVTTALLGALVSPWFLLEPRHTVVPQGGENIGGLLLYLSVSIGTGVIGNGMRRARRRAESISSDLAAVAERQRVTMQSIGDAVIATDTLGRVVSMNPVATELTGWAPADAAGKPLGEVFRILNEETRNTVADPVARVLAEGRAVGLANHTILVARHGAETPIDDSAAPIRDKDGRLIGVVLVFRDVSERRRADRELQRRERDLNDFFENANVGLNWVGPDGIILRANQAELSLLGYERDEYVGHHIAEFHVDRDVVTDILRRLADDETLRGYPARLRCKDGSIRHVLINASVLRDKGEFIHTRSFTLDVTDRWQAEATRNLLASVVESSEDAIVSKNLDGIINSWNSAAARLLGYSAEEAIGKPITLIIPPELVDEERRIIERLRRGERIEHFETVRVTKSGERIDLALTISPVRDAGGVIIGASKVARDITARKRAETRLRTLAAVVEQSTDFIGISTPEMIPIFINEAGLRMVGLDSLEEATRHSVLDFFWPDDRAQIENEAVPVLLSDGRWRGETRFRHFKSGQPIHTIWNVTTIRDDDGKPIAYATVSPNLDALKETQRALEESQAQLVAEAAALHRLHELSVRLLATPALRSALEIVLDAVIELLQADMGTVQLLDAGGQMLEVIAQRGFSQGLFEPIARIRRDDGSPCFRALRDGTRVVVSDVESDPESEAHRSIARDAGYRAVQSTPLIGRNGRLLGVLATHRREPGLPPEWKLGVLDLYARLASDSIERLRDEASLRLSEERFHTLADNISQFAWMADEKGRAFWYNKRWFDYTGTTPEELQGSEWRNRVHHPDHRDRVLASAQRSWETGEPWEETFPLRGVDGKYRWFLSRATPIRGADGKVQRWFGTNTDITDLREAEEALRLADRRKDEFLATLAHELRNPLAPVRNALEIMKRAGGDRARIDQARSMMDRQMLHLERLVDDLLDVSRITRDKLELRRQRVDLAAVVQQAVETVRPQADANGQRIHVELPPAPIELDADAVRLGQVFSNLLSNACKYSDTGSEVWLSVEPRGERAIVTVRDNGQGIPPKMLDHIFEMFAQVPGPLDRPLVGLGIGLTLVRRLVEMHGGTVEAKSEGLGRGSTFVVELPVVAVLARPKPVAAPPAAAAKGVRRRILIVDDNRDAAESLAVLLSISGHETRTAHDGPESLRTAAAFRPDVVLLDIGLPGMNGYEVARQLRSEPTGAGLVLIALTGWGQDEDRRLSAEVGFDHHLVKPVHPGELGALIDQLPASGNGDGAREAGIGGR